ncbi:Rho guanine nucleotide exchange factor [Rhynchospora pubera]|uniref:Rho guanine nucleotide exchange factor n=1 Tax=Rhynchospora pubera TaxID=906938 RepID=A0AAV8DQN2_9POAL|nr:Rho guanine nucleotide exchange factor [Rhynchospora pubera]
MASTEHRKPSIEFIHTFYSGERELFSRMTSFLEIDGDLAFKIISYWLWLEENINKDVIYSILSLSNDGIKRISSLGEQVLTNAAKSNSSTAKKALSGVNYFLNSVCHKAIDDLKDRAEYEKAKKALQELNLEEFLCNPDPSLARLNLSSGDGTGSSSSAVRRMHMQLNKSFLSGAPKSSLSTVSISQSESYGGCDKKEASSPVQPHIDHFSHGGNTSRDSDKGKILVQLHHESAHNTSQLSPLAKAYYPSHASLPSVIQAQPVDHMIDSKAIIERQIPAISKQSSTSVQQVPVLSPRGGAVPFPNGTIVSQSPPNATGVSAPAHPLHPDERTLFVTFSNGSPLTADELLKFFVMRYHDDVESIYIEEPTTTRDPQYAHVTFYHQESVEFVLAGHAKVKFKVKGKHLWARRFIPRRQRRWGQNGC